MAAVTKNRNFFKWPKLLQFILTYTKAAMDNKNFIPPFFYFELGGHLGWKSGSTDTNLEGGHPRIISAKFG
jgi:hypothetical protein